MPNASRSPHFSIPGSARTTLTAAALATIVAAAAPAHADDGLETWNRTAHGFNDCVQSTVVLPIAQAWQDWVPAAVQQGVTNVAANLHEPLSALSSSLSGDFGQAGTALGRFAVNSTVGLAGVYDPASALGLDAAPRDLGTALCALGVPEGPFVVVPFYGPATLRDLSAATLIVAGGVALAGNQALFGFAAERAVAALALVPEIAGFSAAAVDAYIQQKSAYLQHRRAVCGNGAPVTAMLDPASEPASWVLPEP